MACSTIGIPLNAFAVAETKVESEGLFCSTSWLVAQIIGCSVGFFIELIHSRSYPYKSRPSTADSQASIERCVRAVLGLAWVLGSKFDGHTCPRRPIPSSSLVQA